MPTHRLSLLLALALIGCDGGTTASPPGQDNTSASALDWSDMCAARCEWELRCASAADPASPNCHTRCGQETTKPHVFRKDAVDAMRSCFTTAACGSDDVCVQRAILAVVADPTADSRYQLCRDRYESCVQSSPGSFSDDICVMRLMLTPATQTPLDACLAGACAQVATCFDDLTGT